MANTFSEYASFDALGLAQLVKRKIVSPEELLETAIAQIEQKNPAINAVIYKMYDIARNAIKKGVPEGIFQGVPFLLKDLLADYEGTPLRMGSAFTHHCVPIKHSEIVDRFLGTGLVILGKTNTPEFGLSPVTEPEAFGPTHNPWNINYASGGSSGGSAAAVASGMVPMAHGGDGAGSIRIPAGYCGIFGFKPTRGRTPSGPQFLRVWQGMVVYHVLTRTVRDSAAMLDVLAPPELGAPFAMPKPNYSFLDSLKQPVKKLKIALIEKPFFASHIDKEYRALLNDAAKLCEHLGHEVSHKELTIARDDVELAFLIVTAAELATDIDLLSKNLGRQPKKRELEIRTNVLNKAGKRFNAADFVWAMEVLDLAGRQLAEFLQHTDVMLSLTSPGAPPLIGELKPSKMEKTILELLNWLPSRLILKRFALAAAAHDFAMMPFTPLFNIGGNPAMSVPLYQDAKGLPVGIHFGGRVGDDLLLLQLAAQLEKARPWSGNSGISLNTSVQQMLSV